MCSLGDAWSPVRDGLQPPTDLQCRPKCSVRSILAPFVVRPGATFEASLLLAAMPGATNSSAGAFL